MIWESVRNAKPLPSNASSINWNAIDDHLLQLMQSNNMMPKKGISKIVLGTGPWTPEHI
jgi:hypothetical protein